MGETEDERMAQAGVLFENFVKASTCKGTLQAFSILCRQLELDPLDYGSFYGSLKAAVSTWKVKALWAKLDKRAEHKVYNQSRACQGTRCLIIGGGPCGLRTAIELALLGCKVVVIEKRDTFSRNNVLHLWPFTIHDLRGLGAKKFYGKFCAGAIDHISIRQLQLMLLKVSLVLGVEVHVNVEFVKLVEPPAEQNDDSPGWRAEVRPSSHPVSDFDFDVVIGADGRKNTLDGFARKEFRGKLAIAITANFVNRNTTAEAKVEEISGVAFIFNQKFFLELKEETGIDLENIVYYRDNTHYFVMTAKKQSLLEKGVIINDYIETERLLSADNVHQEALLSYAREAADFGTNYQLPSLDYAINHYGQPDVAMFDFTCMYASENAALIREKHGHQLVVALVGDSLLEPFWPMGTGCARGFLAAFDTTWMVKGWAQGRSPLELLAERESLYRLLPQTTTENISKNFEQYTIDPASRYPNLNSTCVRPHQVRHLFIDGQQGSCRLERGVPKHRSLNTSRKESEIRPGRLLTWCQKQTQGYRGVDVTDLTSSWRNGLALCALIHRQRPDLIDYDSLNEEDVAGNNQLAFDVAERAFGIQPVIRGQEMAVEAEPDKLLMVLYLSKFYEAFRSSPGNDKGSREPDENSEHYQAKTNHAQVTQPRKRIPREEKKPEEDSVNKRRRKGNHYLSELSCHSAPPAGEDGEMRENRVRSMATQLQAKFEENSSAPLTRGKCRGSCAPEAPGSAGHKPVARSESCPSRAASYMKECLSRKDFPSGLGGSDTCHFCAKRVYVMERLSAEGYFFHRECFRCVVCNCTLRLGGHAFDSLEAKFYCKVHYAQSQSNNHMGRFRRRMADHGPASSSDGGSYSGLVQSQPSGAPSSLSSKLERGENMVPGDMEVAGEALDASCLLGPTVPDATGASGLKQDGAAGQRKTKQSNRWKRKIRATFPLLLIKRFHQRSGTQDKDRAESVPDVDSDFEEITAAEKPTVKTLPGDEGAAAAVSRKRLMLSVAEKEKLLNWDALVAPEEAPQHREQARAESAADKPPTDPGQDGEPPLTPPSQSPASSPSALQLIASAFRRTFSVAGAANGPGAAVTMRTKHDNHCKQRPASEGVFNFGSLFGLAAPEPSREPRRAGRFASADPWGAGRDLPSLLEQVSLKARRDAAGVSKDDTATLPPRRRVNLFSSLRLRRREGSVSEGPDQELQREIKTILTNLKNKASGQQNLNVSSSSEDEHDWAPSSQKPCPERQRRKQEKTVAQQAKREQLKRLHRAQAIQRQLEEVAEKQRDVEERGVTIEKTIRGEIEGDSPQMDDADEAQLYQSWFQLVLEKNRLARYESELMVFAQELELEDTQSRLQRDLRQRMLTEDTRKSASELQHEQAILSEIMRTVEKRDQLVSVLEEQRLKERAEDKDLEGLLLSKGYEFHWAPADDSYWPEKLE
ncbi:F-actin-monooxygenase mical2b isoform X6 [Nelusetta ayraudi]|uniref:F-actin-monooxygenase mical2b isoform X6 n=1 Tax=Nelusetta ayraudi TaxID=303726 RepID=UPI003F6E57FB